MRPIDDDEQAQEAQRKAEEAQRKAEEAMLAAAYAKFMWDGVAAFLRPTLGGAKTFSDVPYHGIELTVDCRTLEMAKKVYEYSQEPSSAPDRGFRVHAKLNEESKSVTLRISEPSGLVLPE